MKKKILVLCVVLGLVSVLAVPMAVLAANFGDTEVTANFESITITAPTGKTNMVLTTTGPNSLVSDGGSITSNVAYDVTAVDAQDNSKADTDLGYMTEFDGTSTYTNGSRLTNLVDVGSTLSVGGQTAAPLNSGASPDAITIIDSAVAGTDVNTLITVSVTTAEETALVPPAVYRIVITFTASLEL